MTKQQISLNAKTRQQTGKQTGSLRQSGKLPAVLYGHKIKNQNLILEQHEFEKAFDQAGASTLVDLKVDENQPTKVLIYDVQRDAVSHKIIHADLYQVNMKEKIKTDVEIVFIGESPAVKNLSGVLVKALDKIEMECLPGDLISHIDIDLSKLKTFEDVIRVKDLSLPETSHILNEPEAAIVFVEEPRKIEEEILAVGEEKKVEGEGGEKTVEGEEKKDEEKVASSDEEKKESV